ncbi:metallophosphoesterase [Carboxylicivirga sp. M1479]|uniref:metallophosphoesterase n=1 Tax=Carboxylicivirga sp. M1479 TaxID=2594476 RepID=UPI0011775CD2|nr:metallophosphoesterase [Carboxylicivirga sp. M1479]TRX71482.1 metallophosphoesterase [Carboxylicivirga sp. M1479]
MSKTFKRSLLILFAALAIIAVIKYGPNLITPTTTIELAETDGISDGPYVFFNDESVDIKWISNDSLHQQTVDQNQYIHINEPDYKFKVAQLKQHLQNIPTSFEGVNNLVVLSDIHGQYDLFIELLKANKVIDEAGNWSYNNGHLVIIGDAFDRGAKVSETLWHILKLTEQAATQEGRVHYLLGNHDVMVLNADLRYIHEKYKTSEELTGLNYAQLFGKQTLMGQWLRACPVVIRINNILFNHAGLSMAMVQNNISMDDINHTFAQSILDNNRDSIRASKELSLYARSQGPIWYRGYFKDSLLSNASIDSILHHFDAKQIIVGHTSMERVEALFNQRILAADTSIKRGEKGELLFIEDGKYYRAGLDGEKKLLW